MNFIQKFVSIVSLLLILSSVALAEEVPIDIQVPLYLKILYFDRNLKERCKDTVKIGILYDPKKETSIKKKDEFLEVFNRVEEKTIFGVNVKVIPISLRGPVSMLKKVNVVYICFLNEEQVPAFLKIAGEWNILTLASEAKFVEMGAAVGLSIVEDKPKIVINLPASKRQGADFSSRLLRLAKVIRQDNG